MTRSVTFRASDIEQFTFSHDADGFTMALELDPDGPRPHLTQILIDDHAMQVLALFALRWVNPGALSDPAARVRMPRIGPAEVVRFPVRRWPA